MTFISRSVPEVPPRAEPVQLNIYDIHGVSKWTSALGLGLYHTGVVVFSSEFSYGGHDTVTSGIYKIPPKELSCLGDGMNYRTTINFGKTSRSQKEVNDCLCRLGKKFRGIDYNLLQQNCNHFADEFLYFLVRRHLPPFVNRVARSFDFVFSPIIPKSWIQYPCASSASSTSSASNSNSESSAASPSQPPVSSSAKNKSNRGQCPPPSKEINVKKPLKVTAGVAEMNFRTISRDVSPGTNQNSRIFLLDFDGDGDSANNEDSPTFPVRSRSLPRGSEVTYRHQSDSKEWTSEIKKCQSCESSFTLLTNLERSAAHLLQMRSNYYL